MVALLPEILEAATEPSCWPLAIEAIRQRGDFLVANLAIAEANPIEIDIGCSSLSPEAMGLEEYLGHFQYLDPSVRIRSKIDSLGFSRRFQDLLEPEHPSDREFIHDYSIKHSMAIWGQHNCNWGFSNVSASRKGAIFLSCLGDGDKGMSDGKFLAVRQLGEQVSTALEINRRVAGEKLRWLLDGPITSPTAQHHPSALLRGNGSIWATSDNFTISLGDSVRHTRKHKPISFKHDLNGRIENLVKKTAQAHQKGLPIVEWHKLSLDDDGLEKVIICLMPVPSSLQTRLLPGEMWPTTLAVFLRENAAVNFDQRAMRRLYNLTPAEIRLCELMSKGSTLREAAVAEGVAYETIRKRVARVFSKTNTSSQIELLRLLLQIDRVYSARYE